jgi:putative oxidoreductase
MTQPLERADGETGAGFWQRFYGPFMSGRASIALLALRLVVGTAFVMHGSGKIQHPFAWMPPEASIPGALQALAAVSEFGGGLAWIVGLLTPLACLGILSTMSVALSFHIARGDSFVNPSGPGFELALVYWSVAFLLLILGPGRFSLDAMLLGARRPLRT